MQDMYLLGDPIIRCENCGMKYRIHKENLFEETNYIGEYSMGARQEHCFSYETKCRKCGRLLHFRLIGEEYPIGAYDNQYSETHGCEVLYEPEIEMRVPELILSIYEQVLNDPRVVYKLEPYQFEYLVAEIFRNKGFNAKVTQQTRDGGKDIIATCEIGGILYRTYFECKKYARNRPVRVDIIRSLFGVLERDRIEKGVIVTTSYFTKDAVREAERLNGRIKLIDYNALCKMMSQ